jgi:hypothetical protein
MYVKTWAPHPFTADRLSAIALHLDVWAKRAGHGQAHDILIVSQPFLSPAFLGN